MSYQKLLAAGGDRRQLAAAARLAERYAVSVTGFAPSEALPPHTVPYSAEDIPDAVLLPMPVTTDGEFLHTPLFPSAALRLDELTEHLRPGTPVLGGRMSAELCRSLAARGLIPADYAKNEAFALRNAVPTAEGAIAIALRELPVTLHALPVLVLGAGRIGSALRTRLRALGADVTVAARRCSGLARRKGGRGKPPRRKNRTNALYFSGKLCYNKCDYSLMPGIARKTAQKGVLLCGFADPFLRCGLRMSGESRICRSSCSALRSYF